MEAKDSCHLKMLNVDAYYTSNYNGKKNPKA